MIHDSEWGFEFPQMNSMSSWTFSWQCKKSNEIINWFKYNFKIIIIFQSYSSAYMEGKCCKFEWVTKYKCLACFGKNFREDHDNYSEEEKCIGKC